MCFLLRISVSSSIDSSASTSTTGGALSRNGSALSLCSVASGDSEPEVVIKKAAPFKPDPEVVKAAVARVGAAGAAMSEIMNAVKAEVMYECMYVCACVCGTPQIHTYIHPSICPCSDTDIHIT